MLSTAADVGGLGVPSLVSGNLLRSFTGWSNENGDPSFAINFADAVSSVSLDFAGIFTTPSTRLFAYDGATLLGSVVAPPGAQQTTLTFTAANITRLVVTPGDFFDWVGVDNLRFELAQAATVPEPGTWGLASLALAAMALSRPRRTAAA